MTDNIFISLHFKEFFQLKETLSMPQKENNKGDERNFS